MDVCRSPGLARHSLSHIAARTTIITRTVRGIRLQGPGPIADVPFSRSPGSYESIVPAKADDYAAAQLDRERFPLELEAAISVLKSRSAELGPILISFAVTVFVAYNEPPRCFSTPGDGSCRYHTRVIAWTHLCPGVTNRITVQSIQVETHQLIRA